MKLSTWVLLKDTFNGEEYICGATRYRLGGSVDNIEDRYAFIEKTPRVRIRSLSRFDECGDYLNWAERGFKGDGPEDQESQKWCDDVLKLFGYELE